VSLPLPAPLRLVLDTNVVLDLVVFRDPAVRPLGEALEKGGAVAVTRGDCLEELERSLAYRRLGLDAAAQSRALEDFRSRATLLDMPPGRARTDLPLCADPDDQKFLELAWHSGAGFLVTRDKALLRLGRAVARLGRFAVIGPHEFGVRSGLG
jgi:putative PIN family toxin of toxin-antitoxin system